MRKINIIIYIFVWIIILVLIVIGILNIFPMKKYIRNTLDCTLYYEGSSENDVNQTNIYIDGYIYKYILGSRQYFFYGFFTIDFIPETNHDGTRLEIIKRYDVNKLEAIDLFNDGGLNIHIYNMDSNMKDFELYITYNNKNIKIVPVVLYTLE